MLQQARRGGEGGGGEEATQVEEDRQGTHERSQGQQEGEPEGRHG